LETEPNRPLLTRYPPRSDRLLWRSATASITFQRAV
jgi:hypothetical protein